MGKSFIDSAKRWLADITGNTSNTVKSVDASEVAANVGGIDAMNAWYSNTISEITRDVQDMTGGRARWSRTSTHRRSDRPRDKSGSQSLPGRKVKTKRKRKTSRKTKTKRKRKTSRKTKTKRKRKTARKTKRRN